MTEIEALVALNAVSGVGSATITSLVNYFGSAQQVLNSRKELIACELKVSPIIIKNIVNFDVKRFLDEEYYFIDRNKANIITFYDDTYPERLRQLYDPPLVLYVVGEIPNDNHMSLSIVGSRRCSCYGRSMAERFAIDLVDYGFYIVSGMARGIDTAAHLGCLKAHGKTLAVLGCGLNTIYPPENKDLRGEIAESGAVISEFPCSMPPLAQNFPRRNRIVSALSLGTVVIEAALRSGALITARLSLDLGREVFALPGNVDSPVSQGVFSLIKDGAKIVTSVNDIIEELPVGLLSQSIVPEEIVYTKDQEKVLSLLNKEPQNVDQLAKMCDTSDTLLKSILLQLELKGAVHQEPGLGYKRINYG